MLTMETIVCPTDFSTCAENAIHYADELAQRTQARLILCHNFPVLETSQSVPYDTLSRAVPAAHQPDEHALSEKLKKITQGLLTLHPRTAVLYERAITHGITQDSIPLLA